MAGIGFALRDLMRRDGLWSLVESQLHGVVAVAGPWFFTIVAMALPSLVFQTGAGDATTTAFVTLLVYVFSISLVLTGPIAISLTRHVSDCLFQRRTDEIAASFAGALLLGAATMLPVLAVACTLLDLPPEALRYALVAYALVTANWIAAPMLTTLRRFRPLTLAYAVGTFVFWLGIRGRTEATVDDLLLAFALGMAATNAIVCGLILHDFPGRARGPLAWLPAFGRYWDLALGGLVYGAGVWADKWLMWTAPEHVAVPGGLVAYPTYDTVLFAAYVTTVPALALFVIRAETALHEACQRLHRAIQGHAPHERLLAAKADIVAVFFAAGRDVLLLQVCVTGLVLAVPTVVLDAAGVPHSGVFMFRFCAIGAAFQAGVLMLSIVLHYFDVRRAVLLIHLVFLAGNVAFTWTGLRQGFGWYGAGYFFASLCAFGLAYVLVQRTFRDVLYLAFVGQNAALTEKSAPPEPIRRFAAVTAPGPLDRPAAPRS